jgi:diguanylate cyclase (GGDEF)-like protein/PAS domain S-box-containing protein
MENKQSLRALLVEDSPTDALLLLRALRQSGYAVSHQQVETKEDLHAALEAQEWDVVFCDYNLPRFDGMQALHIVRSLGFDMPVIFVSGAIGEETAVAAMKAGAQDYVMKDNLTRLPPAVTRELREADIRRQNQASEALFRSVLDTAPDAILSVDDQWRFVIFNKGAEAVFGYSLEEALGQPLNILMPEHFTAAHDHHMKHYAETGPMMRPVNERREVYGRRKDGSEFPAEINYSKTTVMGKATFTAILRDITERKRMEQQLDHLAHHDELTGLPNRRLLRIRLEQAMKSVRRHGQLLAVLLLDLDRFKNVNDSLGHDVGDALLKLVAKRLLESVRAIDTVARLGGDEFAILLTDIHQPEDALKVSRKILKAIQAPFEIAGNELHVGASIGMALFPSDGETYESLFHNADIAMFRAKGQGGSRYEFYREDLTEQAVAQLALEGDLRRALGNCELQLHYQPQVEMKGGLVIGVEALLRWTHAEQGYISPDRFIPLAEATGLIIPIGEWVLRTACNQARAWRNAGIELRVAVNFSARQFQEDDLSEMVMRVLKETGAAPEWIEIEISESVLMLDKHIVLTSLTNLRNAGFTISLDNFGTGYSCLSHLRDFPVDTLKIDRSVISAILDDAKATAITRAIIAFAHHLEIAIVAEGVETQAQLDFLRNEGCDRVQGYFRHRPMAEDHITALTLCREQDGVLGIGHNSLD